MRKFFAVLLLLAAQISSASRVQAAVFDECIEALRKDPTDTMSIVRATQHADGPTDIAVLADLLLEQADPSLYGEYLQLSGLAVGEEQNSVDTDALKVKILNEKGRDWLPAPLKSYIAVGRSLSANGVFGEMCFEPKNMSFFFSRGGFEAFEKAGFKALSFGSYIEGNRRDFERIAAWKNLESVRVELYEHSLMLTFDYLIRGAAKSSTVKKFAIEAEHYPAVPQSAFDAIEALGEMPNLETLRLLKVYPIVDLTFARLMQAFAQRKKLRVLDIQMNALQDWHLNSLEQITSLEEVNFNGNQITDAGVATLLQNMSLKKIDVRNNPISQDGIDLLKKARGERGIEVLYSPSRGE